MPSKTDVVNVVIGGLGGQGVVKASDILSQAAFLAGFDVKKSEIHGMAQRGGSVSSDVRFGARVDSPMTPLGQADYMVITDMTQLEPNRHRMKPDCVLITPEMAPFITEDESSESAVLLRTLNVALLGILSCHVAIPIEHWLPAVRDNVPPRYYDLNQRVFLKAHAIELVLSQANGPVFAGRA